MEKQFGHVLHVNGVNDALPKGIALLRKYGERASSRGMGTIRVPGPVSTVYSRPLDRVLFDPVRDANPFFHLMEAVWILSGSNRVALPKMFLDNISRFSDDGVTFHGAYGYRLRHAYGEDQITGAIRLLREKPDTRQVVMAIWNPDTDLGADTKDVPCNDMVMLDIADGALNMTVCNRSNDVIWGAYGANAVQFSILQEFIAVSVGVDVGYYVQQSNNYHVYEDNAYWKTISEPVRELACPYMAQAVQSYPLAYSRVDASRLLMDCSELEHHACEGRDLRRVQYCSSFGINVLQHVVNAYYMYKDKNYIGAKTCLSFVDASDWRLSMTQWVGRREEAARMRGTLNVIPSSGVSE